MVGTTQTDPEGEYSIDLTAGADIRIEAVGMPDYLEAGFQGSGSGSTVVFATVPDCQTSIALSNPSQYCDEDPETAVACFVLGDPNVASAGGTPSADGDTLLRFPYADDGVHYVGTATVPDVLSTGADTGLVWGVAHQRSSQKLYTSAALVRFAGFGSGGEDAVYVTDITDPGAVTNSLFFNLSDLGIPGCGLPARGLGGDQDNLAVTPEDAAIFGDVGKCSLGDIEISDDERKLFVMNLADQTLYEFCLLYTSPSPRD